MLKRVYQIDFILSWVEEFPAFAPFRHWYLNEVISDHSCTRFRPYC